MNPLVILDFDGVIRACEDEIPIEKNSENIGLDLKEIELLTESRFITHDVRFAPELVGTFNNFIEENIADVVLATAWNDSVSLFEQIGINWPHVEVTKSVTTNWFKLKIESSFKTLVENHSLEDRETVIWCDDDFKDFPEVVDFLKESIPGVRIFSPELGEGLTREMLDEIKTVVKSS